MNSKPGPSRKRSKGNKKGLHDEKSKVALYNALRYCEKMLEEDDLLTKKATAKLTDVSKAMGEAMYNLIVDMLENSEIVVEKSLVFADELDNSDERVSGKKKPKENLNRIPLKEKIKTVNLASMNPTWNVQTLRKNGCVHLKKIADLKKWEEDIKNGGTVQDKHDMIDEWTYDRYMEAVEDSEKVTTQMLQIWATAGAQQFRSEDLQFTASPMWVKQFKKRHNIQ